MRLIDFVSSLEPRIRDRISAISITTESDGFRVQIDVADWEVDQGNPTEGVTCLDISRHPGIAWHMPPKTDVAMEILHLGDEHVIGFIDACRFDTKDVIDQFAHGYPRWLIKPQRLPIPMRYRWQTVAEAAGFLKISPRRVRVLCEQGRIEGAVKTGRDWNIPRLFEIKTP